jgi:hypothetical protein
MLKSFIKSSFRICGFDLHRRTSPHLNNPFNNPFDAQKSLLSAMEITEPVIFDIGAHRGETVEKYRARFPESVSIVLKSPVHRKLEKKLHDPYDDVLQQLQTDRAKCCI